MRRQIAAPSTLVPEVRRPGLLARIPQPILVAVVGALLTAWLIPGFTRQWQDRQKARELKAQVVASMNSATANAVINSAFIAANRLPATGGAGGFDQQAFNGLDLRWRQDGAAIESQLRAYFPARLVADWLVYQELVMNTYFLLTDRNFLRQETLGRLAAIGVEREHLSPLAVAWTGASAQRTAYYFVYRRVLAARAPLLEAVMASDPEGFSTTTSDIARDLVPFG